MKRFEKTYKKEQFEFEEMINDTSSKLSDPSTKAAALATRMTKTLEEISRLRG